MLPCIRILRPALRRLQYSDPRDAGLIDHDGRGDRHPCFAPEENCNTFAVVNRNGAVALCSFGWCKLYAGSIEEVIPPGESARLR